MMDSKHLRSLAFMFIGLLVLLGGCTFEDGRPWGQIDMEATAQHDFQDRLSDGKLRTANDYLVELQDIALDIEAFELVAPASTEGASFDPANPPDGYTLCHNGHCHADDGSLVDYEDIIAEQLDASGGGRASISWVPETERLVLADDAQRIALEDCDHCAVDRIHVQVARLYVHGLSFRARIFDSREGTNARLPQEGIALEADLHLHADRIQRFELPFGPKHPPFVQLHWTTILHGTLFDTVDWAELLEGAVSDDVVDLSDSETLETWMSDQLPASLSFTIFAERTTR